MSQAAAGLANAVLEAALGYAERGWVVVPLPDGSTEQTTFACCCCGGGGGNEFKRLK